MRFYDLYFILRHPQLSKCVEPSAVQTAAKEAKGCRIDFKRELSVLLPVSHHRILKDFKQNLSREMERYV